MAKNVTSPDMSVLDFSVLLNMSIANPTATVTNLSTVTNAAGLQWIFEFRSPLGGPIHVGTFTAPDVDGVPFTTFTFSEAIPKMFGLLEYDNQKQYTVKVSVKDSDGNIFELTKGGSLCKPNGNTGKNNFGAADIDIETKCAQGQLLVTDKTDLLYKGLEGTKVSTSVEVTYPKDDAGNAFTVPAVSALPCLLPLKTDGDGHEIYVVHIYDYNLGDNFNVRVRYSFREVFAVMCNVTLQPLFCEIDNITKKLELQCVDNADTKEMYKKLTLVNAKMLKAHTGIVQPLSKIDVPKTIEQIKEILGVDCDCCRPRGLSNTGSILFTDAIVTVNKICGDMLLSWVDDGNGNITLNYQDKSYTFVISEDSTSEAFSYDAPILEGCNKAIPLKVDIAVLTQEIVDEIENNPTVLGQLRNIIQEQQLACTGLDGGSLFNFDECDYTVDVVNPKASGTTYFKALIEGNYIDAPSGIAVSNTTDLLLWLNSLDLGVFSAVYSSTTRKTTITSQANIYTVSQIQTIRGGQVVNIYQFTNNCGLICSILQRILNWANALNLTQVKTGIELTVCTFNNTTGAVVSENFAADAKASDVAEAITVSLCRVVNYIKDKLVTCESVKNLFAAYTDSIGSPAVNDVVLMYVNGKCQQMPLNRMARTIFSLLSSDADVKSIYCLGAKCDNVTNCSPVTDVAGSINDTSATYSWSTVVGAIGYKWSIDGINWFQVTGTTAYITGLTIDTGYLLRIYPVYNNGDAPDCVVTEEFTTTNEGAACAAPANLVLNNALSDRFTATWDAVASATGYQYRLNGGGWINIGDVLTITPTGLTPSTNYTFEVRAIIGGTPCPETTSDDITTAVALANTFNIDNDIPGISLDSVNYLAIGLDVTSGAFPVLNGEGLSGLHDSFTAQIRLMITGTGTGEAKLYINGSLTETISIVNAGVYFIPSHSYLVSDIIDVILTEAL